jgi:hypothetical protein
LSHPTDGPGVFAHFGLDAKNTLGASKGPLVDGFGKELPPKKEVPRHSTAVQERA